MQKNLNIEMKEKKIQLSCAPCCWGVENETNPHYPTWNKVLQDMQVAGLKGIELGPYGFFPTQPEVLRTHLHKAGVSVIAGTIYSNFLQTDTNSLIPYAQKVCSLLKEVSASYVVMIDAVNAVRTKYAGLPHEAPRLARGERQELLHRILILSKLIREDYGLVPVLHNHAGGYIEFEDEIDFFVQNTTNEQMGLCIDVGHLYYACMDPVKKLQDYASRCEYVHLKDVAQSIYQKARREHMGYFEACNVGVMCELGTGALNYTEIFRQLERMGYDGWCTIEQERDAKTHELAAESLKRSQEFCLELLQSNGWMEHEK